MNTIVLLLRKLWRIYFFFIAILVFLVLFPAFYIILVVFENFRLTFRLKKVFAALVMFFTGIRYSVRTEVPVDPSRPYVVCSNHSSYLDIFLAYLVIPFYFLMIGKAELKKVPLFNIFFKKMNIPVDRGSRMDSHRAFTRASEEIDKGISLVMFPEGTIPNFTPRLGRFKNGPFKLAIDKGIPILPVTFLDNWELLPDGRKKSHGGKPGRARVIIHKPIPTSGMTEDDVLLLKNMVFDIIDSTTREKLTT